MFVIVRYHPAWRAGSNGDRSGLVPSSSSEGAAVRVANAQLSQWKTKHSLAHENKFAAYRKLVTFRSELTCGLGGRRENLGH